MFGGGVWLVQTLSFTRFAQRYTLRLGVIKIGGVRPRRCVARKYTPALSSNRFRPHGGVVRASSTHSSARRYTPELGCAKDCFGRATRRYTPRQLHRVTRFRSSKFHGSPLGISILQLQRNSDLVLFLIAERIVSFLFRSKGFPSCLPEVDDVIMHPCHEPSVLPLTVGVLSTYRD